MQLRLILAGRSPKVNRTQAALCVWQNVPATRWPADPDGDGEIVREMTSNAKISDLINSTFAAQILAAADAEPDSTRDWTKELPAMNFRPADVFGLATGARLEKLARGATASEAGADLTKTTYRVVRFARQLIIDETDTVSCWKTRPWPTIR